jgi:hypothetical protein
MAPDPFLGEELLAGKEPVHQEVQEAVHSVQEVHLFLGAMPIISHKLADDRLREEDDTQRHDATRGNGVTKEANYSIVGLLEFFSHRKLLHLQEQLTHA